MMQPNKAVAWDSNLGLPINKNALRSVESRLLGDEF